MADKVTTILFSRDKETKNQFRFTSSQTGDVSGSIYIQKSRLTEWGNPEVLEVTVKSITISDV